MRESNPPIQLGRLAPLPIGQWHSFLLQRKERESNSQGSVSARPLSRRLPSPIGLPFRYADLSTKRLLRLSRRSNRIRSHDGKAPVAGVEPAPIRLTGGCLTVWPHRNVCGNAESGRSDLNRQLKQRCSCFRCTRWFQTFPRPEKVAGDGIEPSASRL